MRITPFSLNKIFIRRSRNRLRKQVYNDNNDCTINGHVEGTIESKRKKRNEVFIHVLSDTIHIHILIIDI